jgi:hypothetical protein
MVHTHRAASRRISTSLICSPFSSAVKPPGPPLEAAAASGGPCCKVLSRALPLLLLLLLPLPLEDSA